MNLGGGGGTGLNWGGIGGLGGGGGGSRVLGGAPGPFFSGLFLKANCRKNSFVSLFQSVQNLTSVLSTSLDGTLKAIVS